MVLNFAPERWMACTATTLAEVVASGVQLSYSSTK
jgi:hypothetical protein